MRVLKKNDGQILVMFLMLLPVMIMLIMLVVDTGFMINRNLSIKSVINNEEDIAKIEVELGRNKINYDSLEKKDDCIIVNSTVKALFGKIIGKKEYKIVVKNCK